MAAFAKSRRWEAAARGKPSRQLGNGGLPRPRAKTIIALSSGWLAIPAAVDYPQVLQWAVATAARPPPPAISIAPRELFVMLRQVRAVAAARVRRPLPVVRRRHQKAFRRLVDHRRVPFAKRFIAMLHASGAHRRCNVGAFRTPVTLADARRCRPTPSRHSRSCWPYPCYEMIYDGS